MGLNRNADEPEGLRLGEDTDRSEAVTEARETVGQTAESNEPGDSFDGGAPQSAADVTEAGREADRLATDDDETDRLGRPDF